MKSYGPIARTFHWGFIGIFLYGIIKQVDDISQLEDSALLRFEVLFALLFLAVLAGRFIYMTKTQTSALPENTSRFQRQAARVVHWGMYASLAGIAITGLMIGGLFSLGFKTGLLIEAVSDLYGHIQRDPRHKDVELLHYEEISERRPGIMRLLSIRELAQHAKGFVEQYHLTHSPSVQHLMLKCVNRPDVHKRSL